MSDEQLQERQPAEGRRGMSDLDRLRHSCAHVMATAIARLWPETQFAAGPPVEGGFYYDLELEHRLSPDDFPRIEAEMKKVVKENQEFRREVVSREEARELARRGRLEHWGSGTRRQSSSWICWRTSRKGRRFRFSGTAGSLTCARVRMWHGPATARRSS